MRLHSLQWLLCAVPSSVFAASVRARVYVDDYEKTSQASMSETVDPGTARLILAQRLDLGQFHDAEVANDEDIRQINLFSTRQQAIFGHERPVKSRSKVLIVVEGIQDDSVSNLDSFRSFPLSGSPHPADSLELFNVLSSEASSTPLDNSDYRVLRALEPVSQLQGSILSSHGNSRTLLYVKSSNAGSDARSLSAALENLMAEAKSFPISVSLLFTPSVHAFKKPSNTPYGLTKRAAKAQRVQTEKPLLAEEDAPLSSPVTPISPLRASKVLSGAIPTCFGSLNACQSSTNNCTSHGDCIRKWTSETTNEDGSVSKQDCYGCACTKPDVRKNKDGTKKTTRFGGAACHKKDIVFPFWLLAGSSIFLIFIVSWGIGLLYEMGSQELPSVIGAGVSGPKPR